MEVFFIVLRCYFFVEMVLGVGGRNNEFVNIYIFKNVVLNYLEY